MRIWLTIAVATLLSPATAEPVMTARLNPDTGQVEVSEGGRPVLRYNARTVEPGDLLTRVAEGNRKYAVARSDYLHPLYGLDGEELTRDWPIDHPHHRGIYWAWPEVGYRGELGDLHALQKVFARAVGTPRLTSGDSAVVRADSRWLWDDKEPIVFETATFRIGRETPLGRFVDLEFSLLALADGVTLARRETKLYGGLNCRLNAVTGQAIGFHTDEPESKPRMAWADLSGTFPGGKGSAALTIIPHAGNPEAPPDWVKYDELNWFQPTFPQANHRYALSRETPTVLRYRLWIRRGGPLDEAAARAQWTAYHDQEK